MSTNRHTTDRRNAQHKVFKLSALALAIAAMGVGLSTQAQAQVFNPTTANATSENFGSNYQQVTGAVKTSTDGSTVTNTTAGGG